MLFATRYTGQREDATIGLYFYGARYYDPVLGRFVQADTVVPEPGNPGSLNRYSYVLNNPLKYSDPTGHANVCGATNTECDTSSIRPNNGGGAQNGGRRPSGSSGVPDPRLVAATQVLSEAVHMQWHYDATGQVDYRTTFEVELGDILAVCANTAGIGGVCGVSGGGQLAGPGIGGRGSLDFVADAEGNMAAYLTGGGGAYASTSITEIMSGITVFVVPGASVDDLQGSAVQFGGSIKLVVGVSAEWIVVPSDDGAFHGLAVSKYGGTGVGGEIHGTVTYSTQIYRSR